MEENQKIKWYKNRKILIILSSVLLLTIVLTSIIFICLNKKENGTEKKEKTDISKKYLSEEEITNLYTDTEQYIDRAIKISGKILTIDKKEDYYEVRMVRKVEPNWEQTTIIHIKDIKDFEVLDLILVDGIVKTYDTTDKGSAIPVIEAINIGKAYYVDVVRPTIKCVFVNQTQYSKECSFTITKVEFAEKETRVYMTIKNESDSELNTCNILSEINQNGQKYAYTGNFAANYTDIPSEVKQDETKSGIIVFPAVETSDFTLKFAIFGSPYEEFIKYITFDINV